MQTILKALPPCSYEAWPHTSSEDEYREGKVLHIILQVRSKMVLLTGIVHQDDLLYQLHRWPVDDGMNLNLTSQKDRSSNFDFVTSKIYRSEECGPGLIVEDNDYRSGRQ